MVKDIQSFTDGTVNRIGTITEVVDHILARGIPKYATLDNYWLCRFLDFSVERAGVDHQYFGVGYFRQRNCTSPNHTK